MILKKKKIVHDIIFKRVEFIDRGICQKICPAGDNYSICMNYKIKSSCDRIYNFGIDNLRSHCYIYDCEKESYIRGT